MRHQYHVAGESNDGVVAFYDFGYWDVTTSFRDLPGPCVNPTSIGSLFRVVVAQAVVELVTGLVYVKTEIGPFEYGDWFAARGISMGIGGGYKGTVTRITTPIPSGPLVGPAPTPG